MDYYRISRQELGVGAKIPIFVLESAEEVFHAAALDMVNTIEVHNAQGKRTVIICPVGPVGQYPIFVREVNERKLSLKRVWFINMDEYLADSSTWIDISHILSFRGFMQRTVYDRIDADLLMPEAQRVFPDPRDPGAIGRLIDELGGVDVCYGGIGITGHIAFNEPEDVSAAEFAERRTRVLRIAPETRAINAVGELGGAIEVMPEWCITVGMKEILSARKIRLYCFRDWHRAVVRRAAYGGKSARFPATLLQGHPDARITVTANVAEPAF
ncbi:MAG: 6-phosphogluconolactonase [Rectinema subterraneum]|jgi:glucosamine-6-phosphate deaminase